jgi:hypothetical protein
VCSGFNQPRTGPSVSSSHEHTNEHLASTISREFQRLRKFSRRMATFMCFPMFWPAECLSASLIKYYAMKMHWENGGIALCILNFGTRWRCMVSFLPWSLYPWGKSPQYPLDRGLGGPQSQCGHSGKEKNSHHYLCQELNPVIQPIA